MNKGDQLVVGEPSDIVCRSYGSRPPAHITWYLDGKRIEGGTESVSCIPIMSFKNVLLVYYIHSTNKSPFITNVPERPFWKNNVSPLISPLGKTALGVLGNCGHDKFLFIFIFYVFIT